MSLPHAPLVLPPPGDTGFAALRRKLALLVARTLLGPPPAGLSRPVALRLAALTPPLTEALQRGGQAAVAAFGAPEVLAPALSLASGARPADAMLRLALPSLLVALHRAGALREALLWDLPVAALGDAGATWRFDPPARGLSASAAGVELRLADGAHVDLAACPPRARHLPLGRGLSLAMDDLNPLSLDEAHPDKQGNAWSLGGRDPEAWRAALSQALDLVAFALPGWSAELPLALARLVPVGFEPERHLSASYREAPGLAWLTLHPSALTLAEAVVHEVQHGKLNTLSWLDPVLINGHSTWTASPVRPDLRPLMGVLLAAHAFVPVAALHLTLLQADHPLARGPELRRRRDEVLVSNARAMARVRELGRPTPRGARLIEDLQALHAHTCREAGRPELALASDPAAPTFA